MRGGDFFNLWATVWPACHSPGSGELRAKAKLGACQCWDFETLGTMREPLHRPVERVFDRAPPTHAPFDRQTSLETLSERSLDATNEGASGAL